MYITYPEPIYKCSKCGSTSTETVMRSTTIGSEALLRCIKCRHEKRLYSTEYNENTSAATYTVEARIVEEF